MGWVDGLGRKKVGNGGGRTVFCFERHIICFSFFSFSSFFVLARDNEKFLHSLVLVLALCIYAIYYFISHPDFLLYFFSLSGVDHGKGLFTWLLG